MSIKDKPYVKLTLRKIEHRAEQDENGNKVITGVIPYNKRSVNLGWCDDWYEQLAPGCFNKTLGDKAEVKALRNHNDTEILGNTKSGTLTLTDSKEGLICRCVLPHTSYADDLFETITRGDCTTMSFGMIVVEESWKDEGESSLRTILNAKLDEVSFGVTYPAYPDTNAQESRALNLKPENMTENMKKKILSLADELRSAEGTNGDNGPQPTGTDQEQPEGTPPQNEPEAQTDEQKAAEERQKAEEEAMALAEAEADAFEFEQSF